MADEGAGMDREIAAGQVVLNEVAGAWVAAGLLDDVVAIANGGSIADAGLAGETTLRVVDELSADPVLLRGFVTAAAFSVLMQVHQQASREGRTPAEVWSEQASRERWTGE